MGQKIAGVGLMMEGYGHNPLIYDLMFELGWRDDVELRPWVQEFARFRYGKENADAQAAWETLRNFVYARARGGDPGGVVAAASAMKLSARPVSARPASHVRVTRARSRRCRTAGNPSSR